MCAQKSNKKQAGDLNTKMKPVAAHICHLLAGSMFVSSISWSENITAAPLPLPIPQGAWASARSPLPRVSADWTPDDVLKNSYNQGNNQAEYDGNKLTVYQQDGKTILTWNSFDIDVSHMVEFIQPDSSAIALNRINEKINPSLIMGSLKSNGQLYLINKNGFFFGENSVVDTHSLVVSTLDITDDVFERGITQLFDQDKLPAFESNGETYIRNPDTGALVLDDNGKPITIRIDVDEGAQITSGQSGRVMMFAPSISNAGTISSPDGQVILAAATDKVYLQQADTENTVRGLLVEVETGGDVSNLGNIITERGNTTLMGMAVNQQGLISATTSVSMNGSIRLLARNKVKTTGTRTTPDGDFILEATSTEGGKVTFSEESITQVRPETDDSTRAVAEQNQPKSSVEVMAQTVHLKSGSKIIVPSGVVNIVATEHPDQDPAESISNNNSRILMEQGSLIDVSGIDTVVKSMESNVIEVELRSTELADSPEQKFSFLNGKKIYVDIREGTPLANIQPAIDKIESTVAERSVEGGTVNLMSEGDVIINQGAMIDISGGAVTFEAGYINTTQLLTTTGQILDISEADPDISYQSILGEASKVYEKWGVTQTWDVTGLFGKGLFEESYVEAQDAGTVKIKTNKLIMDGDIIANTVNGRRQRQVSQRATGGTLQVDLGEYGQNVVFQNNKEFHNLDLDDLFPTDESGTDKAAELIIDPAYFDRANLQHVSINTRGDIVVPENIKLSLPDAGSLGLEADVLNIAGTIEAYGSDVSLTALSKAEVGSNAIIDVSGRWVNDNPVINPVPVFDLVNIDAGSITIESDGNIVLQNGASLQANSGAWYQTNGKILAGKGGDITVDAKGSVASSLLNYGANFEAYSFNESGTLTLGSNEIFIVPQLSGAVVSEDDGIQIPLYIDDDFVSGQGFSTYNFVSHKKGLTIRTGAELNPDKRNLVLSNDFLLAETNTPIENLTEQQYLADDIRQPVNLSFSHTAGLSGADNSAVMMEQGASIHTDPLAVIGFSSDTSIFINGVIDAPAGEINLGIGIADKDGYVDKQGIWLGGNSRLSVAGAEVTKSTRFLDRHEGTVLNGGSVNLKAERGFIVMHEDAQIDVSGITSNFDMADPNFKGLGERIISSDVASNAGSISFTAAEGIFIDGQLLADSNKTLGAEGGKLEVGFDLNPRPTSVDPGQINFPTMPRIINVSQNNADQFLPADIEQGDSIPDSYNGKTFVELDTVANSGFDSLTLKTPDEIRFNGDVDLELSRQVVLNAPLLSWKRNAATDTATVNISTAYAKIGSIKTTLDTSTPDTGDAQFIVNANLIDLEGITNLQGFNTASLTSRTDIRLRGVLDQNDKTFKGYWNNAGTLNLDAQQIYPTTLSDFNIQAENIFIENSQVDTGNAFSRVLSAAGSMSFEADTISQAGVLLAPLGDIKLIADKQLDLLAGSLTSTSADGLLIPFGVTEESGTSWIYPLNDAGNLVYETLAEKRILLDSENINFADGAVVDISGGGDLQAYEFVAGSGGSEDVFAGDNVFAVLPGIDSYAPFDHLESNAASTASGLQVGDSIYLSGVDGLDEGNYALLPAHYALLEGGYLVRPTTGFEGMRPAEVTYLTDGTPVTAGYRYVEGTNIRDSVWSGFAVESADHARRSSELIVTSANQLFTEQAINKEITRPLLPMDAGQLSFDAGSSLKLRGDIRAEFDQGGRGGNLDIQAEQLAVVNSTSADPQGVVELLAADLNRLSIESLLLGGIRQVTDEGVVISKGSTQVVIGSDDPVDTVLLEAPEIILAASEYIEIKDGATIQTSEKSGAGQDTELNAKTLIVEGDGALIRVSEGKQASIKRTNSSGAQGEIFIKEGAKLIAGRRNPQGEVLSSGAIMLDASVNTLMQGQLEIVHGSLNLGTEKLSMGDVPSNITGSVFDNSMIAGLDLQELVLTTRQGIDLYGDFNFDIEQVVLDGAGLNSYGDLASTAGIKADALRFTNSSNAFASTATGSGSLTVSAREVELGKGDYYFEGFNKVTINASEQIIGEGHSGITVNADLDLVSQRITASSGADTRISAPGHSITTTALASTGLPAVTTLGGRLDLTADYILHSGRIELPAGSVNMTATAGDLVVAENSLIDVSGRAIDFNGVFSIADAGSVLLVSETNNVRIVSGAEVNISGSVEGGDAGQVTVNAAQGELEWNGNISANSADGQAGGSFELDVNSMSAGFTELNTKLNNAGFNEAINIRQRDGDIIVDTTDTVGAHDVTLTADTGNVSVKGQINASGTSSDPDGGTVYLSAGDNVEVTGTIDASASAAGEAAGGVVKLATIDNDNDGIGQIDVQGTINVSGGTNGENGEVWYRAKRVDSFDGNNNDGVIDDVAISNLGTVIGAKSVSVEALRVYENIDLIRTTEINQWQRDTSVYMSVAQNNIQNRLGNGVTVLPGLEVRNEGDITLMTELDFASVDSHGQNLWRYGDDNTTPGVFTLRAGNELKINYSMSDGFAEGEVDYYGWVYTIDNMLLDTESWSYQLIGGADLSSANGMDVVKGNGSVTLADNVSVRTGTGDIDIAAGSNFELATDTSVVYTAGRARASDASDPVTQRYDRWGSIGEFLDLFYVEYPEAGGDISIHAGGNILGAVNPDKSDRQFLTGWLDSTGSWSRDSDHYGEIPTTWGIRFSQFYDGNFGLFSDPSFRQNIGALGGGNIEISAGGDINDLSVMIPTTGKQVGGYNQADYPDYDFEQNIIEISGGGNLDINAGGNIYGGVFYLGQGEGNIQAGGGLLTSIESNAGPVLALGDSQFNLQATGNISLSGAIDPFTLKSKTSAGNLAPINYFFNYSEESAVELTSLSGDIVLYDPGELTNSYDLYAGHKSLNMYPATLNLNALAGDINFQGSLDLFPSASGQLNVLAAGDINAYSDFDIAISMTDADQNFIPSYKYPVGDSGNEKDKLLPGSFQMASIPTHSGDTEPVRIISKNGSISSDAKSFTFATTKQTQIQAGKDIRDVSFIIQNLTKNDHSSIYAGRDLSYSTLRDDKGKIKYNSNLIRISGPGELEVMAGRNVDLAASRGIESIGNTLNPALADQGADLVVMAGIDSLPDYAALIQNYIDDSDAYASALVNFIDTGTIDFTTASTVDSDELALVRSRFKVLSSSQQQSFLRRVFFNELLLSGKAAAAGEPAEYERGYTAIETLFSGYADADVVNKGDINLYFSAIRTTDGGNIDMFAPAGKINAGLSSTTDDIKKTPDQLGVMAFREGNISVYSADDFLVNQSRIFTVGGGDILVWSQQGDIDAGRGAKTSLAAPPPITSFDKEGNLIVEFPPAVQGSGIRAFESEDRKGSVALFAPKGIIDAGEAGIGSAGDFDIGALDILGADNIDVGGVAVGVPAETASIAAGLTGVSDLSTSASKLAEESGSSLGGEQNAYENINTGFLNIELVGFGDELRIQKK